jgi:hypothetical protein
MEPPRRRAAACASAHCSHRSGRGRGRSTATRVLEIFRVKRQADGSHCPASGPGCSAAALAAEPRWMSEARPCHGLARHTEFRSSRGMNSPACWSSHSDLPCYQIFASPWGTAGAAGAAHAGPAPRVPAPVRRAKTDLTRSGRASRFRGQSRLVSGSLRRGCPLRPANRGAPRAVGGLQAPRRAGGPAGPRADDADAHGRAPGPRAPGAGAHGPAPVHWSRGRAVGRCTYRRLDSD